MSRDRSELPTAWNPHDMRSNMLEVAESSVQVNYTGAGKSDSEAASVRTNQPVPKGCPLFYFEVEVLSKGRDGYIGIGFSAASVLLSRLPGWEVDSFGYHGDDGFSFRGCPKGKPYGPTFSTGDVVGCCLNQVEQTILYTKNGESLGVAFTGVTGSLYPTVGLRTPGESIQANFGSKPFRFDFDSLVKDQKEKTLKQIDNVRIAREDRVLSSLVLSYLVHHGFSTSASALAREAFSGNAASPLGAEEISNMEESKRIREAVLDGNIDKAVALAEESAPQALKQNPPVLFLLKCQKFVELVQAGDDDATMAFGRKELCEYDTETEENKATLQEVFSLLAYPDPSSSPVSYLLDPKRRQSAADALIGAILASQNKPVRPALESLYRQAVVVQQTLLEKGGTAVQLVDFDEDILRASHWKLEESRGELKALT